MIQTDYMNEYISFITLYFSVFHRFTLSSLMFPVQPPLHITTYVPNPFKFDIISFYSQTSLSSACIPTSLSSFSLNCSYWGCHKSPQNLIQRKVFSLQSSKWDSTLTRIQLHYIWYKTSVSEVICSSGFFLALLSWFLSSSHSQMVRMR